MKMKKYSNLWTLEKHSDGSFIIRDEKQKIAGHYNSPEIMAAHFVFSIKRTRDLESERKKLRKFAHDHAICLRMQLREKRGVPEKAKKLLAELEELLREK